MISLIPDLKYPVRSVNRYPLHIAGGRWEIPVALWGQKCLHRTNGEAASGRGNNYFFYFIEGPMV